MGDLQVGNAVRLLTITMDSKQQLSLIKLLFSGTTNSPIAEAKERSDFDLCVLKMPEQLCDLCENGYVPMR